MAKKNRKKTEDLPEGMSRRQAKLAARAAEREALSKDLRPFKGLAAEADLIALQEFVPSAQARLQVRGESVTIVTVLPGAGAALRRSEADGGERLVALQVAAHSQNPGRDLAYALSWVLNAAPGDALQSTAADGTQPELASLIDASTTLEITEHNDFSWWFPDGAAISPDVRQLLQRANDAVVPSTRIQAGVPGSIWWVNPGGGKGHIRWVRTEDSESQLLAALARIAARGELSVGDGTRFAGVFRTHGVCVPVWDVDPAVDPASYAGAITQLDAVITQEYGKDVQLSADERKQLDNIKSRQVTI